MVLLTGSDFTCPEQAEPVFDCVPVQNWEAYLVLLGVPAATAVVAKGITSYKVQNGIVQKTEAAAPKAADAATDDSGSASLVDSQ